MSSKCSKCGHEIEIGQYPFCPHGETNTRYAQSFDPIVLHQDPTTGKYSVPMRTDDPVPDGYKNVVVDTLRAADRITREMSHHATEERRSNIDNERKYWDERTSERRAMIKRNLKERLGKNGSELFDRICQRIDKRRDKRYMELNREVVVAPNVFVNDSRNRRPVCNETTDWRERKF